MALLNDGEMRNNIKILAMMAAAALSLCSCEQEDPASVMVEPNSIVFDSGDSSAIVKVVSTAAWTAEIKYSGEFAGWLTLSADSWNESREIKVSASANDSDFDSEERQALVVFTTKGIGGTVRSSLNVIQKGMEFNQY